MSELAVEPIREVDLHADATVAGPRIMVRMAGSADLNGKARLDRFVAELHEAAMTLEIEDVLLDVRSLDFLSSSCLASLVSWIAQLSDKDKRARYRIIFRSDLAQRWQRRSLPALVSFGAGYVMLEADKPV